MTITIELNDLVNLQNESTAVSSINANSETIETGFSTALNTAGDQMQGTLDMNSNNIINLPSPVSVNSPLRLQDLNTFIGGGTINTIPAGGSTNQVLAKKSNTNYDVQWDSVSSEIVGGTNIVVSGSSPVTVSTATTITFSDGSIWGSTGLNAITPILMSTSSGVAGGLSITTLNTQGNSVFMREQGTATTPTALQVNNNIGAVSFGGYNGTSNVTKSRIRAVPTENWTGTANGCAIEFDSTASGSTSLVQGMRLSAGLFIGSATTDPGAGNLTASGNITATGYMQATSFTGAIPVASLNSGSNANSTTFFRGDNSWQVPPPSAYTKLATLTAGGMATSGIFTTGAYTTYEIVMQNLIPSASTNFLLQLYTNGGYAATGYVNLVSYFNDTGSSLQASVTSMPLSSSGILCNTSSPGHSGVYVIFSPTSGTNVMTSGQGVHPSNAGSTEIAVIGGWLTATSPVTGFQVICAGTTSISSGSIIIYGRA